MNRIRIVLGAACRAFAAAVLYGVLWSSAAAQGANIPGTTPLLTATPPAIAAPQPAANTAGLAGARYVGSRACQKCHAAGSRGSDCVECHMPKIEPTIANINVRSHTFKFISPAMSSTYKIPNPCIVCHTSQTNEWATGQLKTWAGVSPWRIQ